MKGFDRSVVGVAQEWDGEGGSFTTVVNKKKANAERRNAKKAEEKRKQKELERKYKDAQMAMLAMEHNKKVLGGITTSDPLAGRQKEDAPIPQREKRTKRKKKPAVKQKYNTN